MTNEEELGELEVALYRALLAQPGATIGEAAAALERPQDELYKPLDRLAELGLVRGDGERLTALSPMLAEAVTLGTEDLELSARRVAIEERRTAIRALVPDWNRALSAPVPTSDIDCIFDQARVSSVLMHYAERCEREVLSVAPGRLPRARVDQRTRTANLYSLRRGISTRALYQHAALRDRHTHSYLTELAENGAQVRFVSLVPGRSLVIDREVALLPIPTDEPGRHGLAVVREPNIVAWVVATFEQMWTEATPLEDLVAGHPAEAELDRTRSAILRLMAEGEKDEAISRRLSISVRTCRRHIAEYMSQVGATSRFQAGVIAARAGHIDVPGPH
jgi:DNA-binding CsgD family transcriptional regulator